MTPPNPIPQTSAPTPEQIALMAAAGGPIAPAGPPPTPAAAGFAAWAADPRNSSTVANSIVRPGQPILPPNAPQVGLEAQGQVTHGPADPMLAAGPTTPPSLTPAPTSSAPIPATSLPSFDQWAASHPNQVQKPSQGGWRQAVVAGLLGAAGGLHGNAGAGAEFVVQQNAANRSILDSNLDRYKQSVIVPAQTQSVLDKNAATTNYTNQKPALAQASIQQRRDKVRADNQVRVAKAGQKYVTKTDPETGEDYEEIVDDRESKAFQDRTNLEEYRSAIAEKAAITAENAKNHYVPGTPQYAENQRKLTQVDQKIHIASGNLGLRAETLSFDKDKFYDPQPTGQERGKKDLANSAREAVQTMRDIRQKRPDLFGPVAGRVTKLEAAAGIQDADAQRYLTASNIAKDHLTAVFGARSKYALEGTGSLFDTKTNNDAALASFGDVDRAISNFQEAGETHDNRRTGPRTSPPSSRSVGRGKAMAQAPGSVVEYVRGADGKLHPKGGK